MSTILEGSVVYTPSTIAYAQRPLSELWLPFDVVGSERGLLRRLIGSYTRNQLRNSFYPVGLRAIQPRLFCDVGPSKLIPSDRRRSVFKKDTKLLYTPLSTCLWTRFSLLSPDSFLPLQTLFPPFIFLISKVNFKPDEFLRQKFCTFKNRGKRIGMRERKKKNCVIELKFKNQSSGSGISLLPRIILFKSARAEKSSEYENAHNKRIIEWRDCEV